MVELYGANTYPGLPIAATGCTRMAHWALDCHQDCGLMGQSICVGLVMGVSLWPVLSLAYVGCLSWYGDSSHDGVQYS